VPLVDGFEPELSPDGRTVAFVQWSDVWLYDLTAKTTTRVCANSNPHAVSWNPSGTQLVFQGDDSIATLGKFWIWIVNRDGTRLRRIEGSGPHDQYPRWSPDGMHVVWTRDNRLWLTDTLGHAGRFITKTPGPRHFELARDWSPDGLKLLYAASDDGSRNYKLRELGRDSSDDRPDPTGILLDPEADIRWSGDGTFLYGGMGKWIRLCEYAAGGATRRFSAPDTFRVGHVTLSRDRSIAVFDDAQPEADEIRLWLVRLVARHDSGASD